MKKTGYVNEICEAITEIKRILSSDDENSPLLMERFQKEEQRLLNELYEAVRKKGTSTKTTKTAVKQTKPTFQNIRKEGITE